MPDLDYRACTDPDEPGGRLIQTHTHGEALCNPHPVHGLLHDGQRVRQIDPVGIGIGIGIGIGGARANADHFAVDRLASVDH